MPLVIPTILGPGEAAHNPVGPRHNLDTIAGF